MTTIPLYRLLAIASKSRNEAWDARETEPEAYEDWQKKWEPVITYCLREYFLPPLKGGHIAMEHQPSDTYLKFYGHDGKLGFNYTVTVRASLVEGLKIKVIPNDIAYKDRAYLLGGVYRLILNKPVSLEDTIRKVG